MFASALVSGTRRQINLQQFSTAHLQPQQYSPYTFPRLYNKYAQASDALANRKDAPQAPCMDLATYSVRVDQQHRKMIRFIERVKRNTMNMKDSDLKDFALELVEDCQSWADCWRLAADIAGEAWKAFRKAGVVIEEEVNAILDKSRSLGEQAIRRAVRNSRRVLRLARKYPEIYEGRREEWEELENYVNNVNRMIEDKLRTDENSVGQLRDVLDHIHGWHERALANIRVTEGELDGGMLDDLSSDEDDVKSEELEPGAMRSNPFEGSACAAGGYLSLDSLDSYETPEGSMTVIEERLSLPRDGVDEYYPRDVYDQLKKSDVQWRWVSHIVNSLNLITVITFAGVGFVGLFLRRTAPDKNNKTR